MTRENEFRLRPGRIRDRGGRHRSFVAQVLRAAVGAGYVTGGGRKSASRPRGRGRGAALAAALRSPTRRVIIKARVVRHAGRSFRAAPLAAHIRYLKRDGVDRSGGQGTMFDARGPADERGFVERCRDDRHHFRFIVSPEDAAELRDLPDFTRELMRRMETDLGTRLDWVAIDHWNTAHPHVHVLVRGVDEMGQDLVIDREYISRGLRGRAEGLASLELGPRSAREIAAALQRETSAERWTSLDRLLQIHAADAVLDLRPGLGTPDLEVRPLLKGRAVTLERLGFATSEGPAVWRLSADYAQRLRELAERVDIIATLHRSMGQGRALADLLPYGEQAGTPILGRLADRGLHDELSGSAYVIIDGVDGRAHHVRLPDLGAAGDTPLGGLVELRPGPAGPQLFHRSDLSVEAQVAAEGATWLDRQLLAREPADPSEGGFGAQVRKALAARANWLVEQGLARRVAGGGLSPERDLLATLRARDLASAGARLARETGLRFEAEVGDPQVRGRYARRVDLASGRFAMVEDGLGFRLVPWARALDRQLGHEVRGALTPGGVDWDLGRSRGLSR